MMRILPLLVGLSVVAGCQTDEPTENVTLEWHAGELFHVGAAYRVANVRTTEIPVGLDGNEVPSFGEHWTDELVWTYQVVETGLVPEPGDELHPYALQADGSVGALSVMRAYLDPSLNADDDLMESDPVVYLVLLEDRDRLAAVISFTNVDGERVERSWSTQDLDKSWSVLSQSMLTAAPTYLAPFTTRYADDTVVLENGSLLDTVVVSDGVVDAYYDDELGGGLVMSRYEVGQPWPVLTVSDNVSTRLLDPADVAARRAEVPFLTPEYPEDFDYRAALASTIDVERALVLDEDTLSGGWSSTVAPKYQPWAGYWWPLREADHVFGWRGGFADDTFSDLARPTLEPLKQELEQIADSLRDLDPDSAERAEKISEYQDKQGAYVDELVDFYNDILQGLTGGQIVVDDGKIQRGDEWSFDIDDLSPFDKYALHMYLEGQRTPNPFFASAWALLNSWAADHTLDNAWFGYCNGWAAAAILEDEPRESALVTAGSEEITYEVADLKALTSALHYSVHSRFYGQRYYGEESDPLDLYPKAFHQLVTFYLRDQGVPLVFDTDPREAVWNFPAYAADLDVVETTDPDLASRININTADAATLQSLHGIGEVLSQRIVEHRLYNGPFQAIEDLTDVHGIGNGTLSNIQDDITVDAFQRTFDVCAEVQFTTDGVSATHLDPVEGPPAGFTQTWCYTLDTDANGRVSGLGTWHDEDDHPDFAWIPYDNPLRPSTGGSQNPYLSYHEYVTGIVDLRR